MAVIQSSLKNVQYLLIAVTVSASVLAGAREAEVAIARCALGRRGAWSWDANFRRRHIANAVSASVLAGAREAQVAIAGISTFNRSSAGTAAGKKGVLFGANRFLTNAIGARSAIPCLNAIICARTAGAAASGKHIRNFAVPVGASVLAGTREAQVAIARGALGRRGAWSWDANFRGWHIAQEFVGASVLAGS